MEIGSIFEIDPASVMSQNSDIEQRFSLDMPDEIKKYNKQYCVYTASGRESIALALRSMEQSVPVLFKKCLLPAYMCDTVFFPFEHEGWEIHFYNVNKELVVSEDELRAKIELVRPSLLFIHSYYGVDTWKSMRSLLAEFKKQGICIMEDVTQSYYLKGAGAEANYVVGSLRKWYPVPDGGFVVSDLKLAEECLEEDKEYARKRLGILMDKWEYLYGEQDLDKKKLSKETYLQKNRELEGELDRYAGIRNISNETAHIFQRINEEDSKRRRSDNYRYLYERLKNKTQFVPILSYRNEAAPLYFAIYADRRDELQSFLRDREIYAPVLWPVGEENKDCLTADEEYIYAHMLALPIDQRYGREDMQRIAEVMEEYENSRIGEEKEAGISEVIGIRADANEETAMGHIMRCITIAKQLKKLGKAVLFFTADEYASELLDQAGMEQVCLHSEWNQMEKEIPVLKEELKKRGCSKLLVDSYYVSARYFEDLSELCKLIYIDDCFEGIYPVDMLINYNAYHVRFNYKEAYRNRTKLMLGTSYVPLREEFRRHFESKSTEDFETKHVFLSSGGGDIYNALAGILSEAVKDKELEQVIFHTVVGRFNPNVDELRQLAKEHTNIKLHYDVKNMAKLMAECQAAVSAAGTVLFELSAMQIPTVFFVCADNQQYDSEFFAKEERMLFAGDIRAGRERCVENILEELKKILKDEELCLRMKKELFKVTDGSGAERIAEEIVKL